MKKARYRKVFPRIWNSLHGMTSDEIAITFYLLTSPQTNRIGLYRFSPAGAADDLGMSIGTFRKGFAKVLERFGWTFDKGCRVMFIPSWFTWNQPENPNVLKACLGDLAELPLDLLTVDFSSVKETLPQTFHVTFAEGYPKPSPKPSPNQEQEQEQEQETTLSTCLLVDLPDFEIFWTLWKERCGNRDRSRAEGKWNRIDWKQVTLEQILQAVRDQSAVWKARKTQQHERPMAKTWLYNKRWNDTLDMPKEKEDYQADVSGKPGDQPFQHSGMRKEEDVR